MKMTFWRFLMKFTRMMNEMKNVRDEDEKEMRNEEIENDVKCLSSWKSLGNEEVLSFFIKHSSHLQDIKEDGC